MKATGWWTLYGSELVLYLIYIQMIVKEAVQKETDYLQEQISCLAEDIIDLNEDIDGLTEWSNDFVDHYNNALENTGNNFEILDKRTKETIDKYNNVAKDVSNLNFNVTFWWGLLILNIIFTLLLVLHVL